MTDDKQPQNTHPTERQPLFNKLEHQRSTSPWHNEGLEWSKTGRNIIQMLQDAIRSMFS